MKKLFKGDRRGPKMLGIVVPVIADPVLGPTVTYDEVLESGDVLTSMDRVSTGAVATWSVISMRSNDS